ncbi:divalent-cation tolerance protein CutA [Vulcanococcus sp.]|uniref:divalent-cation tolerance protein CutA n=1 Tax=Vulcanococcus sp. TaxID=2856995 RepID=UPI003F6A2CA5
MAAALLALTTEASRAQAEKLAELLLERHLACCVALKEVESLYRWKGQLERSHEVQLLIKSDPCCAAALEQAVRELHSYTTPQWLTWCAEASADYAAWLSECCATSSRKST